LISSATRQVTGTSSYQVQFQSREGGSRKREQSHAPTQN
jgi:hypothetical protein